MARIMTRSKPVVEGSTGIKFSEIIVIAMVIAAIVYGVRWYMDYRHSASAAVQEFMGAVKAGNPANQYAMIDASDKNNYFPTLKEYERANTLAHGYTERVENVVVAPEEKDAKHPDRAIVPVTVAIRGSGEGKQLYETGGSQTYQDRLVMHKKSDGNWRVLLSASWDKNTRKLHLQNATPSPESQF